MKQLTDLIFQLKSNCISSELDLIRGANLSYSEYRGIVALGMDGQVCSNDLSEMMNLSPSRGSRVIDVMVQNGILSRQTDQRDRRRCLISLARKGKQIKGEIEQIRFQYENKLTQRLNSEEAGQFTLYLQRIMDIFE